MYIYLSWAVLGTILGQSWSILGRLDAILDHLMDDLAASWGILRRLEHLGATWCAVLARLSPSKTKNVNFPFFFKSKNKKSIEKRYVLKATNGETQARIKKMIEKRGYDDIQPGLCSNRFSAAKTNYDKNRAGAAARDGSHAQACSTIIII